MTKYTGDLLFIKFGTLDISGQGRTFEVSQSADEIEVTTYASTDKEFIVGMADRSASMEILDDDSSSLVRVSTRIGSASSMVWGPQGTANGKPKFTVGTAVVREQNLSYPYDDAVLLSLTFRLSGAVTEGTWNAGL